MAIKVIIKRKVPKEKEAELLPLLLELRSIATYQTGYISGETLRDMDNPFDFLVISTWRSIDEWNSWVSNTKRAELLKKIDELLGEKTEYSVYYYG